MLDELSKISTEVIQELVEVITEKVKAIESQHYEKAAYARDKEKRILSQNPKLKEILMGHDTHKILLDELVSRLRDYKINIISE
jgi:predicted translin family RNA/ssDNA-binding protein